MRNFLTLKGSYNVTTSKFICSMKWHLSVLTTPLKTYDSDLFEQWYYNNEYEQT